MKATAAEPMLKVRDRAISLLLGGGGEGPRQSRLIQAKHVWCEEQLKQPFKPVAWIDDSGYPVGVRLMERGSILSRMAVVYRSDTGGLKKSPELKQRIEETLANILEHFNPKTLRPEGLL